MESVNNSTNESSKPQKQAYEDLLNENLSVNLVEQILQTDPAGIYGRMAPSTRDSYRHAVESIARNSPLSDHAVADMAIRLAAASAAKLGINNRRAHVGYYLIDDGLPELERAALVRLSFAKRLHNIIRRSPLCLYLGVIALFTATFTTCLMSDAANDGMHGWLFGLLLIASMLASSHLAIALINWVITLLIPPHVLPRMDFTTGIPHDCRTLVAVPSLLYSAANVDHLSEALEVRFLANRDQNLRFCLLTDFSDAHTKTTASDAALLQQARRNIDALNATYPRADGDNFILLHRPRQWNPHEQAWIGQERKRGKLADLNSFLRHGNHNVFQIVIGNIEGLTSTKYVIALDSDTQLPRDSARRFVATMAHPLNRAHYDKMKHRVTEGYGVLQPRVSYSLPHGNTSLYERLHGGEFGIDQYTSTVSDVYQDLFREGSFIGKGIYDVDIFNQALSGRFPDNRILSHDLIEGCHVRCALLSDAQLYEDYPATYSADAKRHHRWIRGDWQLIPWLFPLVPDERATGKRIRNPLSALSQWKLIDNLRRSLVSASLTFLFVIGWISLPPDLTWNLLLFAIVLIPPLCFSLRGLMQQQQKHRLTQHLKLGMRVATRHFAQALLKLTFLPYDAWFSIDAILRASWRTLVSHQRTLEWNPSAKMNSDVGTSLAASIRNIWFAPALAVVTLFTLMALKSTSLLIATPLLLLWFFSPGIAWWISRPNVSGMPMLKPSQLDFLRRMARKTWEYFETYVGPDDNWLPPDNVQELPVMTIARRTAPTNIGLALLANLAACDFGYITAGECVERTQNSLLSMEKLERYNGHFYNWYDTQTLQLLDHSACISTVDSGNLAAYLLTLRSGLMSLIEQPVFSGQTFEGIRDTFNVLKSYAHFPMTTFQQEIESACQSYPDSLQAACAILQRLTDLAREIEVAAHAENNPEITRWSQALLKQCTLALNELKFLAPWAALQSIPERISSQLPTILIIPTLQELAKLDSDLLHMIETIALSASQNERAVLKQLGDGILQGSSHARERMISIRHISGQIVEFTKMNYGFLYDPASNLLTIAYKVSEREQDPARCNLLASEARLCSFVAIAQGQLPQASWFALGRRISSADGDPALLSWNGSMFEYLMPLLVMPSFDNTLLDQTVKSAVKKQIAFGKQYGVPWGISDSGFYAFDQHMNYQYSAFGIPALGIKNELTDDLVISPYASMLALMVAPEEACDNLQRLAAEGLEGPFGLYEAVDYTPSRLPPGQSSSIVHAYMSHHQGMSLLSLVCLLQDHPMQQRFMSDPLFKSILLLLQERASQYP